MIIKMTEKAAVYDYSVKSVRSDDPSNSTPMITEAVPSEAPSSYYDKEEQGPSDCAIMAGCGLAGWLVW
jgi:hypothetical protein